MFTIGTTHKLYEVKAILPQEVFNKCLEIATLLDNEYGSRRNIDKDLGGFIALIDNSNDFEVLRVNHYLDVCSDVYEDIETIETATDTYYSILYLTSSDYAINVVANKNLLPQEVISKVVCQNV